MFKHLWLTWFFSARDDHKQTVSFELQLPAVASSLEYKLHVVVRDFIHVGPFPITNFGLVDLSPSYDRKLNFRRVNQSPQLVFVLILVSCLPL